MSDLLAAVQRLRAELTAQGIEAPYAPAPPRLVEEMQRRYGLPALYRDVLLELGQYSLSIRPGPFQELALFAAPDLERAQVGYRGSRPGDDSFVAPHGWRRHWVVIAADAGDPYFLDLSKVNAGGECPVYTAMHGTGAWEPRPAAASIEQFVQILTVWTRIVVPHYDPQNPDEPLDDAQVRRLASEIERIDPAAVAHWTT